MLGARGILSGATHSVGLGVRWLGDVVEGSACRARNSGVSPVSPRGRTGARARGILSGATHILSGARHPVRCDAFCLPGVRWLGDVVEWSACRARNCGVSPVFPCERTGAGAIERMAT
jgi:hypothetical protein